MSDGNGANKIIWYVMATAVSIVLACVWNYTNDVARRFEGIGEKFEGIALKFENMAITNPPLLRRVESLEVRMDRERCR